MQATLAETLWLRSGNSLVRKAALALAGSAVLAVSAKIQIPFYPVPMTMQTFVVLVIGMAFGWRLGVATILLYLAEGAAGLPVFAGAPEKGVGLAYMLGGTGGYLAGFVLAAAACGYLAERGWDRSVLTTALTMLTGSVLIYTCGLLWLGGLMGWDKPIFEWGLLPFLYGEAAKLALATLVMPFVWRIAGARTKARFGE